jgi:hypothetical protein
LAGSINKDLLGHMQSVSGSSHQKVIGDLPFGTRTERQRVRRPYDTVFVKLEICQILLSQQQQQQQRKNKSK